MKPFLIIKSDRLPERVLCVGIKTKDETIMVAKRGTKAVTAPYMEHKDG